MKYFSLLLLFLSFFACSTETEQPPTDTPPSASSAAAAEQVGETKTNIDWDNFFKEQEEAKKQNKKVDVPKKTPPKPRIWRAMNFKSKGAHPLPVYDTFAEIEHLLHIQNDTTYIVNFWATWCAPCVAELPHFERLNKAYQNKKVRVLLVSLDFKGLIPHKLMPFMQKNKLQSDVVVLADPKASSWIDRVDKSWDGAIPVTVIYKGGKRKFIGYEVANYQDLESQVKSFL